jgi:hypothetical protein
MRCIGWQEISKEDIIKDVSGIEKEVGFIILPLLALTRSVL